MIRTDLMSLDPSSLESYFSDMGEKPFRARQLLQWFYQRQVKSFDQMTDLSKELRQRLSQTAHFSLPEIIEVQVSADGTRKWLLELEDGNQIEMVYIPEPDRGTLCVSSQAGCALNCSFCATARRGFNRNLTTGEIIGQLWLANSELSKGVNLEDENISADMINTDRPVSNVVLMGMGEPLLNFENVVRALRLMQSDYSFGLSKRRITLSTAGIVPKIDALLKQCPVSLAVSLHAPDNDLRSQLVPLNQKYPVEMLLAACRRYVGKHNRQRITFEYVMLEDINDSAAHANRLAGLLADLPAKVNLIPFNPSSGMAYRCSNEKNIARFRDILLQRNIFTITRRTRGGDIDAACGQLVGKFVDRTRRSKQFLLQ